MKTINQINSELLQLLPLIEAERELEVEEYAKQISTQPLAEQRRLGLCRYPMHVTEQLFNKGEHLLLKLSQDNSADENSKNSGLFKSGRTIKLFEKDFPDEDYVTGVVNNCDKYEMTVTLNTDSVQDWMLSHDLCVQIAVDNTTYREMTLAVNQMASTDDPITNHLKEVLYEAAEAQWDNDLPFDPVPKLNESQNRALSLINAAQDVAIVHGPPGTGKTTTIISAILMTLRTEKRVLVCAPSNAAADLITEKLAAMYVNVVRVGQPARIDDVVLSNTLDYKIAAHPNYKDIKKLRKKANEYRRLAGQYKRKFGDEERRQRTMLYNEARAISEEADDLAYYISNDIITNAQVIACTLVGSNYKEINNLKFRTVFIDEAAQALEPACLIPILKAERVIFAGDHCQLPPTVKSRDAIKGGLAKTLFEKLMHRPQLSSMLGEQYRMNEKIMAFSNQEFYDNQLIANACCSNITVFDGDIPMEFIDTAGAGFAEKTEPKTLSTYNEEEAQIVVKYLESYMEIVELHSAAHNIQSIGIISPYKAQVDCIIKNMKHSDMPAYIKTLTTIDTADSFQGREKDVIIISLARSNTKGEIGFLNDTRRMNVAMTRARRKLIIFGDSATIAHSQFYDRLVNFATDHDAYKSIFEILY
ncbi:MAG: AAA family ATPase [Bacteroidales bacterium]|nr:AAA family ATPase [Bacteroidales bacterium]